MGNGIGGDAATGSGTDLADGGSSTPRRQDRSREKAAALMAADARRRKRLLAGSAAAALLVVLAAIGFFAASGSQKVAEQASTPAGVSGTAIRVGAADAPVVLEVYQDFRCSVCRVYEDALSDALGELVAAGKVAIDYHIMSFLGPESERAANAAACAADEGKFAEYHAVLMANQPQGKTGGFTNADLVAFGQPLGLGDEFAACVNEGTFAAFTDSVDVAAAENNVNGTPTFVLDGERLAGPSGGPLPPVQVYERVAAAAGALPEGGGSGG